MGVLLDLLVLFVLFVVRDYINLDWSLLDSIIRRAAI